MIPSTVGFLDQDFEVEEKPSKVYRMDIQGESIRGFTDKQEAMEQSARPAEQNILRSDHGGL